MGSSRSPAGWADLRTNLHINVEQASTERLAFPGRCVGVGRVVGPRERER